MENGKIIMKPQQADKATARPWKFIPRRKESDGRGICTTNHSAEVLNCHGTQIITTTGISESLWEANAALIVQAVNEHALLCKVEQAADNAHSKFFCAMASEETKHQAMSDLGIALAAIYGFRKEAK